MGNISGFLERYKHITIPNESVRVAAQKVIRDVLKTDVAIEDIAFQNSTLFIQKSPALRTEIAINQQKILAKLKESLNEGAPLRVV